jgi:1,4-dihydroxy-2-naphthoate octaprenyltransferase
MHVFLLTISQSHSTNLFLLISTFLIIHLLVYPASNGYNSYVDKDETSIGGLEKPPQPTKQLFYLTIFMDCIAVLLSFFLISFLFALCIFIYILISRAYSSRLIRLKKYAIVGFLVVVIFQGAFTYIMSSIGITSTNFEFTTSNILLITACSFQIAGAYPLTQIYQHKEDIADGVITLSYRLGYTGTFIFTTIMFILCNVFYYFYFKESNSLNQFMILQFFFIPILLYFSYWFIKVLKDVKNANFKNTMRMNMVAAASMNSCFVVLYFINH